MLRLRDDSCGRFPVTTIIPVVCEALHRHEGGMTKKHNNAKVLLFRGAPVVIAFEGVLQPVVGGKDSFFSVQLLLRQSVRFDFF